MKKLLIVLVLFVVFTAIGQYSKSREAAFLAEHPEEQRARDQAAQDRMLVSEAKLKMRQRLKDPESAQFSDVMVVRVTGKPVVCGEVNAKNSFGGFTGRKGFVMPDGGIPIGEDDLKEKDWVNLWNMSCTDAGTPKNAKP